MTPQNREAVTRPISIGGTPDKRKMKMGTTKAISANCAANVRDFCDAARPYVVDQSTSDALLSLSAVADLCRALIEAQDALQRWHWCFPDTRSDAGVHNIQSLTDELRASLIGELDGLPESTTSELKDAISDLPAWLQDSVRRVLHGTSWRTAVAECRQTSDSPMQSPVSV